MAEALESQSHELELNENLFYNILEGDARDRLKDLEDESVHLIVTSPPYGQIKHYSPKNGEIGYGQNYNDYHQSLMGVFREAFRVLHPGCRLVINIGDEFVQTTKEFPFHIVPHASQIISNILTEFRNEIIYNGTILWKKVTTSKTSGGGKIMGSVYHPRNGHFFVNYEHIIVFKKLGKGPKRPNKYLKELSRFTLEERRQWFNDTWQFAPARQNEHIAMFPLELPERIIRMYSFAGDVVLDPFAGSGTTLAAAAKNQRSGIGVELGFTQGDEWKHIMSSKFNEHCDFAEIDFT